MRKLILCALISFSATASVETLQTKTGTVNFESNNHSSQVYATVAKFDGMVKNNLFSIGIKCDKATGKETFFVNHKKGGNGHAFVALYIGNDSYYPYEYEFDDNKLPEKMKRWLLSEKPDGIRIGDLHSEFFATGIDLTGFEKMYGKSLDDCMGL